MLRAPSFVPGGCNYCKRLSDSCKSGESSTTHGVQYSACLRSTQSIMLDLCMCQNLWHRQTLVPIVVTRGPWWIVTTLPRSGRALRTDCRIVRVSDSHLPDQLDELTEVQRTVPVHIHIILATRSDRTLLGAPGLTTRSKDATTIQVSCCQMYPFTWELLSTSEAFNILSEGVQRFG